MKKYHHLLFDLDHTLWDFEANSQATLQDMFSVFDLLQNIDYKTFYAAYKPINLRLWDDYEIGLIDKETVRLKRFEFTLQALGIHNTSLAAIMSDYYITHSPTKGKLITGAIEVLQHLSSSYSLHLITNGFKEVQYTKIRTSGLDPFFSKIIVSEMIGNMKPSPKIFEFALNTINAQKHECLMIGDSLQADVGGALNFGMDVVFFNPEAISHNANPTHEINMLHQLLLILK